MTRILITDGEQRSSLAATRSLGRAGHEVTVISKEPRPLAGASRHCSATLVNPDPGRDPEGYRDFLDGVLRSSGVEVVLPMTDVSAPFVLSLRDRHPGVVVPFPPTETYEAISDKARLMAAAEALGVPVPRQLSLDHPPGDEEGEAAVEAAVRDLRLPVVVKPARSAVETDSGTARFSVTMVPDRASLEEAIRSHPAAAYPLLLQERIQGSGMGVFALFWEGEPIAWFAHRRLREKPPTGGVSVYRESVHLREDLKDYAGRLLSHFRWSGVAMVEFKEDEATGDPYLMEINGRFWGSLQLAVDAGVDFPRLLVEAALGGRPKGPADYRAGVRSRWLWGDLDHTLAMLRRGDEFRRTHPELPGSLRTLGTFLVPWRPGDRFEVLQFTDPGPFLRECREWFRQVGR
jgi:predicted ATP-grasp superfamily ATP-dependent carboligase